MGDFDGQEIEVRVNKPKIIGDAISHYTKLDPGRQARCFRSLDVAFVEFPTILFYNIHPMISNISLSIK